MRLLLDAAMGTALIGRGLPAGTPAEAWLLENPDAIAAVHASHAAAGAELLLTCTFGLASPRLAALGAPEEDLARRAVRLARAAGGRRVAGAWGPTGLVPRGGDSGAALAEAGARHARAARALAAAGADMLWAESHGSLQEALVALEAGRATGLPVAVTLTLLTAEGGLSDASGTPAADCLGMLASRGAAAVGLNCDLPGTPVAKALARAVQLAQVPIVAKPSAGLPGRTLAPSAFAAWIAALSLAGASWLGGCCGTTAEHLAAIAAHPRG